MFFMVYVNQIENEKKTIPKVIVSRTGHMAKLIQFPWQLTI